jgi:hypothetical protein
MQKMIACLCGVLALAILAGNVDLSFARGKDDPKYTIKEVMQKGHKGGLLKKVTSGTASADEAKTLLEMYKALGQNTPPKGDADDWKKTTKTMADAAQLVVDGKKDDGIAALKKAVNCGVCHGKFK